MPQKLHSSDVEAHWGLGWACRASLKEPTRPVTPADYGRQLFASGDPSNRPSTSYSVSGRWDAGIMYRADCVRVDTSPRLTLPSSALVRSRGFYQDGGPKLALPKLETGRPGGF